MAEKKMVLGNEKRWVALKAWKWKPSIKTEDLGEEGVSVFWVLVNLVAALGGGLEEEDLLRSAVPKTNRQRRKVLGPVWGAFISY